MRGALYQSFFAGPSAVRASLAGPFTMDGTALRDRNGALVAIGADSGFLLSARQWAGESIQPQLDYYHASGTNLVRVFGAGVGWNNDFVPGFDSLNFGSFAWQRPDWAEHVRRFFQTMDQDGIAVEFTIGTGPESDYAEPLQQALDLAAQFPLVFVETFNEPWNWGSVDPVRLMSRVTIPPSVLWAYGIQPEGIPGSEDYAPCPVGRYGTTHLPRDRAHAHNPRDIDRMQAAMPGTLWANDECMAYADYDHVGSGARTTDKLWICGTQAIGRIFSFWNTRHSQLGLEGRAPAAGSISADIGAGISAIWRFIPAEAYTGRYTRAGNPDFPFVYTPGDSDTNHAYGAILDNVCYAVLPLPTGAWNGQLTPTNGWRLDALGPFPWIGRFVR